MTGGLSLSLALSLALSLSQVDLPDFAGRVAILGVHSRGKPLETDVDMAQARPPPNEGASEGAKQRGREAASKRGRKGAN